MKKIDHSLAQGIVYGSNIRFHQFLIGSNFRRHYRLIRRLRWKRGAPLTQSSHWPAADAQRPGLVGGRDPPPSALQGWRAKASGGPPGTHARYAQL
jgi:hypothetical protein